MLIIIDVKMIVADTSNRCSDWFTMPGPLSSGTPLLKP